MSNIKYLRVIVNQECNLSCFFCHKEGSNCEKRNHQILDVNMMVEMIDLLIACGINKIKFLGGEPTLCKNLPIIIKLLKKRNPNIDYSMITNGAVKIETLSEYVNAGLNRINVSLHGYNGDIFTSVTGGSLKQLSQTINSIKYLNEEGILGKINYVVLKGVNETEFIEVLEYIHKNNLVLDALNYLGNNKNEINKYYYSFDELIDIIKTKYEVENVLPYDNASSLPSTRLILKDGGIVNLKTTKLKEVNFLNSCSICMVKQFCLEGISAIRLTSAGIIKPCIFRDDNTFDLKKEIVNNDFEKAKANLKKYLETL